MIFCDSNYLKPIINGTVNGRKIKMLIDSGADYTIINVPKNQRCKDDNGDYIKDSTGQYIVEPKYSDQEYDELIRDKYGSFVKDSSGKQISTNLHGFGNTVIKCRLILLKDFKFGDYEFKDSYVLLDETGFATKHDMVLGTSCLRNFIVTIDYENRSLELSAKRKELSTNYENIFGNINIIEGGFVLPADIYYNDYMINDITDDFEER